MATNVGWDLNFLQSEVQPSERTKRDSVKEKNSIGNENQILGTSKYGRLHYQVSFEKASDRLQVTVVGCQDLKVMDISGSSDPYVIVHLPNTAHSNLRTRTVKKCLSPVVNETFAFQIQPKERPLIRGVFININQSSL